jgi:hypothetical protein
MPGDVRNVLRRIWGNRMDPQQFEDISAEMQTLHKSMKNLIEIVFAISPLLALSTHGWDFHSVHSTYLLRVSNILVISWYLLMIIKIFVGLGNDRPPILIQLEDHVLNAILAISEGRLPEDVINTLYSEIVSLEKNLGNDQGALHWFKLSLPIPPTPPSSTFPLTPLSGIQI